MPTLSQEQITEIEVEMGELLDENERLRQEIEALKAQLLRAVSTGEPV